VCGRSAGGLMSIVIKAVGIWIVILVAAIINGIAREKILIPAIGFDLALPISGLILSVLVLLVVLNFVPFIRVKYARHYFIIGLFWLCLTLVFEFIFGLYILGKSWQQICEIFNIKKGDLFSIVLVVILFSPWLTAKLRGFI
jgi:hypothetical protein